MHGRPHHDSHPAAMGPRLGNIAADLAGLSVAIVGVGVTAVRRAVERIAWGRPCGCGHGCGGGQRCACDVHHDCHVYISGGSGCSCC